MTEGLNVGFERKVTPEMQANFNRLSKIEVAARVFVEKYEKLSPNVVAAFQVAALHGFNYTGANYGDELKELKVALGIEVK